MFSRNGLGKKGFAVQFNWLFVLIGGAIIFGFFISIIINQMGEGEKKEAGEATKQLSTLLKVSLASRDTQKTIDFDKKIIFYCENISEYSEYYVAGSPDVSGHYTYNVIFAPNELEGRELIIQTLTFKAPFKVIPIVYVTNKDIEYVFVGSSGLLNQLYNALPDSATKKMISLTDLTAYPDNNYDSTVFIFDKANMQGFGYLDNKRVNDFDSKADWERIYGVVINASGGNADNYGNISFYKYGQPGFVFGGSSPFLSTELALGAVISHDKTIYECNLRKTLHRLVLLSKLYMYKMNYYGDNVADYCQTYYTGLVTSAEEYLKDIQSYAEQELSADNFRNLLIAISYLRSLNRDILTTTDCPRIY